MSFDDNWKSYTDLPNSIILKSIWSGLPAGEKSKR